MIKKIRNLVFLFFLTSSCGYNPIYEEGSKFSLISGGSASFYITHFRSEWLVKFIM